MQTNERAASKYTKEDLENNVHIVPSTIVNGLNLFPFFVNKNAAHHLNVCNVCNKYPNEDLKSLVSQIAMNN